MDEKIINVVLKNIANNPSVVVEKKTIAETLADEEGLLKEKKAEGGSVAIIPLTVRRGKKTEDATPKFTIMIADGENGSGFNVVNEETKEYVNKTPLSADDAEELLAQLEGSK